MPKGTSFRIERALDRMGVGMNPAPSQSTTGTNYDASHESRRATTARGRTKLKEILARRAALPKSTGAQSRQGISSGESDLKNYYGSRYPG
ncbi:MAG: hypothetical protein ACRDGA_07620 [Bacteroidota bacterium]